MIDAPSIAARDLIRTRIINSPEIVALVPVDCIANSSARPKGDRSIVIGPAHTRFGDYYESFHEQVFLDVHVYCKEMHTTQAETLSYLVRKALRQRPWPANGWTVHGLSVADARFYRDPDGEHSLAALACDLTMQETGQ